MLIFVDLPKNIRVLRVEETSDGTHTRTKIASISKHKMEITSEIVAQLSPDEVTELESVLDLYHKCEEVQVKAAVLRFPQTVREVIAYATSDVAGELEKRLVLTSLVDALGHLRRAEREANVSRSTEDQHSPQP